MGTGLAMGTGELGETPQHNHRSSFVENNLDLGGTPVHTDPGIFNLATASLLFAGMFSKMIVGGSGSHSRTKRQTTSGLGINDFLSRENNVFYRVLGDLDQEDCIALAICHASSISLFQSARNGRLLSALGIRKEDPVPWTNMNDIRAKFQYAAFVGHTLSIDSVDVGCKSAFPLCALPADDVLKLLTNEVRSCEAMMDSLQRLLPDDILAAGANTTANEIEETAPEPTIRKRQTQGKYYFTLKDFKPAPWL